VIVRAPAAERAGIDVESRPLVEAEADVIGPSVPGVIGAHACDQHASVQVADRREVERIELRVGAVSGAPGAAIKSGLAITGRDADRTDRRNDLVADVAERTHYVRPVGRLRERVRSIHVAFGPGIIVEQDFSRRQHAGNSLLDKKRFEGAHLGAARGHFVDPEVE